MNNVIGSRRKEDLMIQDKKVLVNGDFAIVLMKGNSKIDSIYINGKELKN